MKILLLTVGTINYDCDINFYEPLQSLGFEVTRYNYIERMSAIGRKKMNEELLITAETEDPQFIFYITYRDEFFSKTLKKLKARGHRVVAWFSDDHWRFDNYSRFIAANISCSITTDIKSFYKYKSRNLNVIKSQWASNPDYYYPIPSSTQLEVTFVGQKYGPREAIINYLDRSQIPIKAFGKGWGDYLEFEAITSLFSNSKINLNISASSANEQIKQMKGRVFEVTMCGGFLLTDYAEQLEKYFHIGKEIVCYDGMKELEAKIRYYLAHEDERTAIAMNGFRAARERNTWAIRFTEIFEELDLLAKQNQI